VSGDERDWRVKYREALMRLETEEARANRLENVLRLLAGRLCLAAQGRDEALDQELARVSGAVRKHSDAERLEELLAPLSQVIAALDSAAAAAKAAPPAARETPAAPAAIPASAAASAVPAAPTAPTSSATESDARDESAHRLQERLEQMQRERFELEALVQQMTARLDEIENHLAGEMSEQSQAHEDSTQLDLAITGELEQLRLAAQRADDLTQLRRDLTVRLDRIATHVQDFRAREELRTQTYRERTQRMRTRISALERESRSLQQNLKEEQRQAMIDALTGIPNRAAYDDRIEQEFKRWKRFGRPVTMLAWDVDGFKSINDAYGHKAGDKVLRIVGQHLVRHVRDTDFVARYGGDEFVMLLVGSSVAQAQAVAEKIRTEIATLGFHFHEKAVQVTLSCGMTAFAGEDNADDVFDRADRALYGAKKQGKNCWVVE